MTRKVKNIRMDDETSRLLKVYAAENGVSMGDAVRTLLREKEAVTVVTLVQFFSALRKGYIDDYTVSYVTGCNLVNAKNMLCWMFDNEMIEEVRDEADDLLGYR